MKFAHYLQKTRARKEKRGFAELFGSLLGVSGLFLGLFGWLSSETMAAHHRKQSKSGMNF
jgi:hypothetical protein